MQHSNVASVVAIDGPSGSGKSTVAKKLAQKLGLTYIDTGAMFRALAYICDQKKVEFKEGEQLTYFLKNIDFQYGQADGVLISIDGIDLTEKIRAHQVSKLASIISQLPSVRKYLLDFQRSLVQEKVCVMEGRDIGTVVFPHAFCKFFITASVEVRAQRRFEQLREAGQTDVELSQVISDVAKRDASDINREVAPLKKAEDAEYLDTSDLDLQQVVDDLSQKVIDRAAHFQLAL